MCLWMSFNVVPGCPGCCWVTCPPMPVWWPEAPATVTWCSAGPADIIGWPGWPGATGPGGLHFDRPFPNPTAATSALVSAGLKDGLFCLKAEQKHAFLTHETLANIKLGATVDVYLMFQSLCRHEDYSAFPKDLSKVYSVFGSVSKKKTEKIKFNNQPLYIWIPRFDRRGLSL